MSRDRRFLGSGASVWIVALLAVVAYALTARSVPVFPPMVGGDFVFRVLPVVEYDATGVLIAPAPGSIGIHSDADDSLLACVETPDPAPAEPYVVTAKVNATGQRASFHAFAYLEGGCTGLRSDPSENQAFTYPGMKANPPDLQ